MQGGHVRPSLSRIGELRLVSLGITSTVIGLNLLAALPLEAIRSSDTISTTILYLAATALAYTSATVVTGLTAAAAGCCDEKDKRLKRGRALGSFRSAVGFPSPKWNRFFKGESRANWDELWDRYLLLPYTGWQGRLLAMRRSVLVWQASGFSHKVK